MNRLSVIIILLLILSVHAVFAQRDLPNPLSDSVLIPAGSYVIPMDTLLQNFVPAGQAPFNLKSYGLVNRFLHHHIPVRWAIRSGKNLNEIDFSAMAERVFPDSSLPSMVDFRAGPFIVVDTAICGMSTYDIIQEFGDSVAVYRLTQPVTVDVRYTIIHRPKVAIFINGGNQIIHSKILDEAGIPDYDLIDAANIASLSDCYTFVSEPHWDLSLANQAVINSVKNFVLSGGNFLAQCQAVETYENLGFFMTTLGIALTNTPVSHSYHNADLAAMQIHGGVFENQGGSVSSWTLGSGSVWNSQTYKLISNNGSDTVVAMGTHLTAPLDTGGNAFFIGCHDYMKNGVDPFDLTNINKVNELRMYLNAVMIPSIDNNLWANAGADQTISCNAAVSIGCTSTAPPGTLISWFPATGLSCTNCPNPVASPAVTTNYALTVTGANGCSVSDFVTINVVPPIITDFFATTVCINNTTLFTDQSTGTIANWNWDFGDGSTSSLQSPSHNYASPGNYLVTLSASNYFGCLNSIQQTVVVNPLPVVNFSSTNACIGSPTCFSDLSTVSMGGISNWNWSFGDPASGMSDTSTVQNPCHTFISGSPNVTLCLTTTAGCRDSITLPVSLTQLPVAGFSTNNICLHSSATFSDQSIISNGDGISRWDWDFGDTVIAVNQQNPSHQYNSVGTKNVKLAVTTAMGCQDTIVLPLIVHDNPVANFSNPVSGCAPVCASFNDISNTTDGTIASWQWNFPGGIPSSSSARNPSVCFNNPGSYQVDLLVTTSFGCQNLLSMSQYIEVHSLPVANFCVSGNGASFYYPTYNFCDQWSPDVVKWYWDFGDNSPLDSISRNPIHSYSSSLVNNGYYTYTVSVYVQNQFGCVDSINQSIDIFPEYTFYIPNSFTPNGDYSNKFFYGKGRGINDYSISIYNRWGEKIWNCHQDGLFTDWDADGDEGMPSACKWDGVYEGKVVQEDVYVWRVDLVTLSGREVNYTGHVSVLK